MCANSGEIKFCLSNVKLDNIMKNYYFYYLSETFFIEHNLKIKQVIKESKFTVINQFSSNKSFFIIAFEKTIIIIPQNSKILQFIFEINSNLLIYFINNSQKLFENQIDKKIKDQFRIDSDLDDEISIFNQSFKLAKNNSNNLLNLMSDNIRSCISGYMIEKANLKSKENQLSIQTQLFIESEKEKQNKKLQQKDKNAKEWDENDYLVILNLHAQDVAVLLIYLIEIEEFCVIKKPNNYIYENEITSLLKREKSNYDVINHPQIPKLYGVVKDKNYLIIQYINGQTLENIKNFHFKYDDKIRIIFQIIKIIKYLHDNGFVYRDLKPSNVMIDENKTIFLIDFDRMLKYSDITENENRTINFSTCFIDPNVNLGKISYKNDIYSIGQMIYYIIIEKEPDFDGCHDLENNAQILSLYKNCTNENIGDRPNINILIKNYYDSFKSLIKNSNTQNYYKHFAEHIKDKKIFLNDPNAQYDRGLMYYKGQYITQDINRAIHYFSLAANQNIPEAQFYLGLIYYIGKYIKQDISKSYHYFSLVSKGHNRSFIQYAIGIFNINGVIFEKNVIKGINFLISAANDGDKDANFQVGYFYHQGKYIDKDIKKMIHYYKEASSFNSQYVKNNLGIIFKNGIGEEIKQNLSNAMVYFDEAIKRFNDKVSMYNLAHIYIYEVNNDDGINTAIDFILFF